MNDIKLIILGEELELVGELGFSLNYNIDDIRNPTNRNGNYSKTVSILGTKKANKLLGGIFDINSDFTYFNPKLKSEVKILVNSVEVINGYMQIKSINKEHKGIVSDSYVSYEVNIQSNSTDFFTDIKDKKLNELDFSDFNHDLTNTNIEDSWTNESSDCYVYPLFVNDVGNVYETSRFKPAIFHKAYLMRIIGEAGYASGGSLLDDSTAEGAAYSKDIIPFNGGESLINIDVAEASLFQVGQEFDDIIFNRKVSNFGESLQIPFPETANADSPNFNNGDFDGSFGLIAVGNGSYNFRVQQDLEVVYTNTSSTGRVAAGGVVDYLIYITINGDRTSLLLQKSFNLPTLATNGQSQTFNFSFDETSRAISLINNQECYLDIQLNFRFTNNRPPLSDPYIDTNIKLTAKNTIYSDQRNRTGVTDGDLIVLKDYIPKKIKQSDIITDLIKRYNAYIYIDPNNSKKIIFDSRDSFYNSGGTLDWTEKKDYSKKDKISLLSDLQNKELNFTYTKEKDDFFNDKYFNSVGVVFGSKEVNFKTDFGKGTREVKTPFAPTPLVGNSLDSVAIVSAIDSAEPGTTIRVLHYGGVKSCLNGRSWTFASASGNVDYLTYPYAGHLDDPKNPTIDINFGQNEIEFYNEGTQKTDANLFNRFWKNYVDQINSGKVLTVYFNLNEIDIFNIKNKFNTKIFVKDAYYYINKISDYNPISKNVTKVELLKINKGVTFVAGNNTVKPDRTDNEIKLLKDKYYRSDKFAVGIATGNGNNSNSGNAIVRGKNNFVGTGNNDAIVIGDNNYIADNSKGAFLIGASNKIISEDNVGYVGGLKFKDNKVVEGQIGELIISDGVVINLNPYKSAQFRITYSGSGSPSLLMLSNDSGKTITATSIAAGILDIGFDSHPLNDVVTLTGDNQATSYVRISVPYSSTVVRCVCRDNTTNNLVDQFNGFFIELRFYN